MNQKLHVMKRCSNWVVLVTGGASGIGRATSVRLASEGAQVIIADKDTELGEKAVSNIEQNGGQAIFIPVDLANDDSVKSAGQAVAQSYLSLDAIVNNAAILIETRPNRRWFLAGELGSRNTNRFTGLGTNDARVVTTDEAKRWLYC